jgi:hypothetical protein
MADNRYSRRLEEGFVNKDTQYNFGGFIPGVIFGGTPLPPSPTPTFTPTATITMTPTATITITPTNTQTPTQTNTQTPTQTNTPTNTQTPTQTNTPTQTQTNTPTLTPTFTSTPTLTPTLTNTPTNTPSVFDPDYQAILNYATSNSYTLPTFGDQVLQNNFLLGLKSCGVWNKFDVMYVFKAGATTSDALRSFSKINWKNPNGFYILENGSYSSNFYEEDKGWRGFNGNPPNEFFLETGYNPSTNSSAFTQNDASLQIYLSKETDQVSTQWLGLSGITGYISMRKNSAIQYLNSSTSLTPSSPVVNTSGIGYKALSRSGATDIYVVNGDVFNTRGGASVSPLYNEQILILKQGFGEGQDYLGFVGIGGFLNQTETTCMNNLIGTYMSSVAPVPTNTPTPSITRTATPTRTSTRTPTPTATQTPTPTPSPVSGGYLLYETGDVMEAENGDLLEYDF